MASSLNFSIRRVYWPSQQTTSDWSPTDINTAGDHDFATDGSLVCGRATRGATLIWTTTDLWTATYIGAPFLYSFERVGRNCGIIGQQACVVLDSGAYWMGKGKFFHFDGYVRPVLCEVTDYVFGDFNDSLADRVWAFANPKFGEVTWFYPSSAATNANPTDKYVTYNYIEHHWVFGVMSRSCGVTFQPGLVAQNPVLIGPDGKIYDHEVGTSWGGAMPTIESGPMQVGEGDSVMRLQRIVPDDKTQGDVNATIYASLFPDLSETANGPYTLSSPTSIRVTARQVRLKLTTVASAAWRVGIVRLGAVLSGRR